MMYKVWGRIRKNNKIVKDMVVPCDPVGQSKEDCLHYCIQQICYEFDLQRPVWFPKNQREYDEFRLVTFNQDNFMETVNFDALEIEVIEDE
ncbi:MAG TPA: hypothetical protein PK830_07335 [Candidatus Atribacteria bacterium]|nr:hypothetical protein [Candidatus Atribacteria bacterium]HPT78898.1 hypothetical protein [Candidatus Atribacteria bacterium]